MTGHVRRRGFLKAVGVGTVGLLVLRDSRSAWSAQANEKVNVALVGLGSRGGYLLGAMQRHGGNVAAVCDADRRRMEKVPEKMPSVPRYQDFRKMLEEREREIDAVVVATPDHTHAAVAAAAMKRGKHVYCEKPIAHDVGEARTLRLLARERKAATQMGNQGMASDAFRRTLELIQEGAVGEIREVHLWYGFGGPGPRQRPKDTPPVPEHLDWDLWLGPAPFRPYHPTYIGLVGGWGGWRDFSTGCLGGGGSHSINLAFKALRLGTLWEPAEPHPRIRVEAECSDSSAESFPRWEIVRFDIPARGPLPPVRLHWYNAQEDELRKRGIWAQLEKLAGRPLDWKEGWAPRSGSLLVGTKGVVHTNPHNSLCALLPEKDFPNSGGPPRSLPRAGGQHEREWLQACRGGAAPLSCFDHSGPAIELLLLGNIATLLGKPLEFDPVDCKVVGNPEADRALRPQRREGWAL